MTDLFPTDEDIEELATGTLFTRDQAKVVLNRLPDKEKVMQCYRLAVNSAAECAEVYGLVLLNIQALAAGEHVEGGGGD